MAEKFEMELRVACEAVRAASALCQAVQAGISTEALEKKDRSPVTVADFGSQALVCRTLAAAFPDDPVIAEETSKDLRDEGDERIMAGLIDRLNAALPDEQGDEAAACGWIDHGNASEYHQRFWTLDPIDGTKGFLRGEQYAISLALIVDGELAVAALACPNLPGAPGSDSAGGSVFAAVRGQGASVTPLNAPDAAPRTVTVSETLETVNARFCESYESGHSSHDDAARIAERLRITADPVRLDSQAKYAIVARGEADIYLRLPTRKDYVEKIWDHAGGALLVTEAGGKVTDVAGAELDFTHGPRLETNRGIIVTNGHLHDRVLEAVGKVLG